MDPRSKLAQKKFKLEDVLEIFDRTNKTSWDFERAREQIVNEAVDGEITFIYLRQIIDHAKTTKMIGTANRGADHILNEVKKLP